VGGAGAREQGDRKLRDGVRRGSNDVAATTGAVTSLGHATAVTARGGVRAGAAVANETVTNNFRHGVSVGGAGAKPSL